MAFQNVIDALSSTIHRDTISNPMVEKINGPFKDSLDLFPYQLSSRSLNLLNQSGIQVTKFGPKPHPHAFHKTVELHILHKVWPNYMSSDSGVMFMKESKYKKISKSNKSDKSLKNLWNYKFIGKDAVRFENFSTSAPDNKTLFMHDAIMYFSCAQILDLFGKDKNLERLFATLVVPAESDFCDSSFYPNVYKFKRERDKGKLIYEPEGHSSGSYRQPSEALKWLKTSKIIGPDFSLKISLLESWGPIHLLMIEKSTTAGDEDDDSILFKTPDAILLPNPVGVNQSERDRLVPTKVYNGAFSYVRSVRTLRDTDPAGFVRTQINKEEYDWVTSAAWDNLQNFILRTAAQRPKMYYSVFNSRLSHLISNLAIHSEKLGWASSILSSLVGLWVTSFACKLSRSKIHSAAFLWRWIKKPARKWFELKVKPAPFFKVDSEILRRNLLWSSKLQPLCDEYPRLFKHFQEQKPKKYWFWLKLAAFGVPLAIQFWSWLAGKYAPQQLDMIYQSYFHPKPWQLELKRSAIRISPQDFFPAEMPISSDDSPKLNVDKDRFSPHPQSLIKSIDIDDALEEHEIRVEDNQLENQENGSSSSSDDHESNDEESESNELREDEDGNVWVSDPSFPLPPSDDESDDKEPDVLKEKTNATQIEPETEKLPSEAVHFSPSTSEGLKLSNRTPLKCGVEKFLLQGYHFDFSSYSSTRLRNRLAIFFSRDKMNYGHDKVKYIDQGWPSDIKSVADFLSNHFNDDFNSVLVNIYEDSATLPWHADDEECYDDKHCILTLVVQGNGFFSTKHDGKACNRELLSPDDLLVMPPGFQSSHKHCVSATTNNRISLTFRHQNHSSFDIDRDELSVKQPNGKGNSVAEKKRKGFSMKKKPKLSGARVQFKREEAPIHESKIASTVQPDEHGVFNEQPLEDEPEVSPVTQENLALQSDPSAIGPVRPFREIFKANYVEHVALFLSRERNGASPAPKIPSNKCLLLAFAKRIGRSDKEIWQAMSKVLPNSLLRNAEIEKRGLNTEHLTVMCAIYERKCILHTERGPIEYGIETTDQEKTIHINYSPERGNVVGHFFVGGRVQIKPSPKVENAGELVNSLLTFNIHGALLPIKKVHNYQSDVGRAKNLISNMKNGFDGVMANVEPLYPSKARDQFLALDLIMDGASSRSVKLVHIVGFAGCGKSFPVQELLKTGNFKSHKVAVPTVELRGEWKDAMQYKEKEKWRVSTWESSMLKSARVLVIDEVYKMPRGYLDLSIHADSTIQMVIVLGDPLQGSYHSTNASSNNKNLTPEVEHLSPYVDYYCLWSRRIPKNVADFFDVPTTNEFPGIKLYQQTCPSDSPILCNAVVTAKLLADTGHSSTTIASSQGSTYDSAACVLLDRSSSLLSQELSSVALTRSRRGIIFSGDKKKLTKDANSNHVFADFWHGKKRPVEKLFQKTLSNYEVLRGPLMARPKLFGAGKNSRQRRRSRNSAPLFERKAIDLRDSVAIRKTPRNENIDPNRPQILYVNEARVIQGDGTMNAPQIDTDFLPESRRPLHFDLPSAVCSTASPMQISYSPCPYTHVYPGENFETLVALLNPAHDPEMKEIVYKDERSNQFPLIDMKFEIGALPSSTLAAVHNAAKDKTLLPASIEKRLVFRHSDRPYEITAKDELLGSILYSSLSSAYGRNPNDVIPFDEFQFAECICANEYAQLSNKTKKMIIANANRSDPDWRYTFVRIFSKTQHKVNENSLFGKWKACQTLALMHDAIILILGPVKKYQRIYDKKDRPKHMYVHAGNTPFEMSEWCKAHLTDSLHVSNDYTSFDQSQHGEAVVLEKKKMERLSIPSDLIDMHVWLKTHVETQFGPLTCMRLTGEPGTYDDNTDYNLAVLHSQYQMGSTPHMVSGDDSMLDSEPAPNPIWPYVENLLHLRFKLEKSFYALFCGYYVGKHGACRSPLTLFAKLAIAVDDGSIYEKRLSYLTEFAVGHGLGEEMWQLLPFEQVQSQCANFDYFCRFAPREEKLLLKLGEPEEEFLNSLFATAKYISVPVFSLLKSNVRKLYLGKRNLASFASDKEIEVSLKWLSELSH